MEGDDRTFRVDFSSEGVSRLREAVKEKLKEFMGDYTDDTLVEYVIVLLKNGRRKDEAKSELNVFLGDDDSDSFVSWLWDHLGSHINVYVQQPELPTDGAPKTKPTAEDQGGKTLSHQIESEAKKAYSTKTSGHNQNRERTRLVRDGDEIEVPLPRNSPTDNVNSRDEPHRRASRTKPSLSPRPTIHKKRRRTEEQQPRKQREVSQPTVSAPRRLLQFAVRDAVGTSKTSSSTAEPSVKRLRSVVSTSTGDLPLEERPLRIHRASMSAAIKAVAEAVKDVSKVRPPRNVFDRLGHATDVSNTTNLQEYGGVAEDVDGGDFSVEVENFDSIYYHPLNDSGRLQIRNMPSFHETIMDADLGYDGGNYDDFDVRGRDDTTDISRSGPSVGNWVDSSQRFQYDNADNFDERLRRPRKDLVQPATVHNTSLRIASTVSMNSRKASQYQEEREVSEMDNRKIMQDNDAVTTKSQVWLMKENNNPTVAFNGNAKPDTIPQHSEKTQTLTGPHNTGPPTEDADSRTIFVSNVHFAATKDSLSRHFNKFGEVLKVIILTDPTTGQPKGSAYIEFMRKEAAELALSLDGTSFMSRLLKIVRKISAQPEAAASAVTWPRIARASPFAVPRFSRAPFARGLYRGRVPMKPGSRSFQWKREADSTATETSGQGFNTIIAQPTTRSLTYVRTESKANGSSGTA